ncbi:Hypothetical Protein FCC1311_115242 [Hondaea fermentalgiana]|uniref:Uncharacterized protein n=1 Tax=Hondaea fermentalgiana TaxID=2315210 RepID=A0A2R5H380_9STRA|nr:Hypothetical Protein FCC1311_115242 [Hondaea fermentalgiana]|eukprot:GBG35301.1 Hypothetical Protein FCC1311_115242 [Hondaea fermentalgiana]
MLHVDELGLELLVVRKRRRLVAWHRTPVCLGLAPLLAEEVEGIHRGQGLLEGFLERCDVARVQSRAPKRKRHRLDPRYVATLQEALEQSSTTMDAVHFFREKWGQTEADWSTMPGDKPASFPDDKQLKTKLVNMKQALKKQRSEV